MDLLLYSGIYRKYPFNFKTFLSIVKQYLPDGQRKNILNT